MVVFDLGVFLAFAGYLILVLCVGFYFYKKSGNLSDYMLGSRGMNPYVTALSAQASDMSGWLLMGLPGALYLAGMSEAWIGIGLAVGAYISWLVIAKRLRHYTFVSGDSITLPEFFENRFRDKRGLLRLISSVVILVFFTFYVASGFIAGGNVFTAIFPGFDFKLGMFICVAVIIAYTFLGGFMAVCWTDFFQGMLMIVAIVIVPLAAMGKLGGFEQTVDAAKQVAPEFLNLFSKADGSALSPLSVISNLAWGLGYLGMPHILVRYMAIKDARMIKVSRRVATGWIVIALIGAILIGVVGRVYLGDMLAASGAEAEKVFMVMAFQLFPPVVAGILLSAILAAVMSTADSQLLVASSAITNDIYKKFSKKQISDKRLMWIGRFGVIGIALIAIVIALTGDTIMGLVSYAWAGFGAAFGPVILMALFWKRTNAQGALAGIIGGFVTVILWKNLASGTGLYELVPGFVIALILCVVVSLATKEPTQEIQAEFEEVRELCSVAKGADAYAKEQTQKG